MARTDKSAAIAGPRRKFESSGAMLLIEYRGLTVMQLKTLRRTTGASTQFKIARDTLAKIAAKEARIEGLGDLLTGPTAFAFITGEIVDTVEAIRDFVKDNLALLVKGRVLEGNLLSEDDVKRFTDLESREVFLSKAASMLKTTLFQAAYVFQTPVSKTVRTINALHAKEGVAAWSGATQLTNTSVRVAGIRKEGHHD